MSYTVHELSKLAGVSTRTLHYYDEIGLLKPSSVKENGYRQYGEKELLKLQQILFFRELDFPLKEIMKMITSSGFDMREALNGHKKLLRVKGDRIRRLLITIDRTIEKLKGGDKMKNDDLFASFDDTQMKKYREEAKRRWGHTEAYKQSMQRTKHWTKEDYRHIKEKGDAFTKELARAMDMDFKSNEVQELIRQHHEGIEVFYDLPLNGYRLIGNMYVEDKRFTAFYERYRTGLAQFMKNAINYYCDTHKDA